jgi:hypothetical protein
MTALRAVSNLVAVPAWRRPRTEPGRRRARHLRRLAQHDPRVRHAHRRARTGLLAYVLSGDLSTMITAPVVYSLLLPMALLDAWVTLFQRICFPAWGLPRVRRRPYFVFDRQRLAYLNGLERLNCVFCGYANGVLAYVREVAARTEQYWCPIRHGRRVRDPHAHYSNFVAYGDAEAYRRELPALRRALATLHGVPRHARRLAP